MKERTIAVGCVLFGVALGALAAGDKQLAFSKRIGVEFLAEDSGAGWCKPELRLRVQAQDAAVFHSPDFQALVRQVGAQVLAKQCGIAEKVNLRGFTKGSSKALFLADANKADGWTLVAGRSAEAPAPDGPAAPGKAQDPALSYQQWTACRDRATASVNVQEVGRQGVEYQIVKKCGAAPAKEAGTEKGVGVLPRDLVRSTTWKQKFMDLTGNQYPRFLERLAVTSETVLEGGWIVGYGQAEQAGTYDEAALAIDAGSGKVFAAMLVDRSRIEGFGFGKSWVDAPAPLQRWAKERGLKEASLNSQEKKPAGGPSKATQDQGGGDLAAVTPPSTPASMAPSGALKVDDKNVTYRVSPQGAPTVEFQFDSAGFRNTYSLDCPERRFLWTKNVTLPNGQITDNNKGAEWRPLTESTKVANAVYDAVCPTIQSAVQPSAKSSSDVLASSGAQRESNPNVSSGAKSIPNAAASLGSENISKVQYKVRSCSETGSCGGCKERDVELLATKHAWIMGWIPPEEFFDHDKVMKYLGTGAGLARIECGPNTSLTYVCIREQKDRNPNYIDCKAGGWVHASGEVEGYSNSVVKKAEEDRRKAQKEEMERAARERELNNLRMPLLTLLKDAGVEMLVPVDKLEGNPFGYEGRTVAVLVQFRRMLSSSEALFWHPAWIPPREVFVSNVPKTRFSHSESTWVLLVGKVRGIKEWKTAAGVDHRLAHVEFMASREGNGAEIDRRNIIWAARTLGIQVEEEFR